LRITGVRTDGYHLIDAIMTTLELHDELSITPGNSGLEFTGPYAAGISADDNNLVTRALKFVDRTAHVIVTKNIPHGGGLGGGSLRDLWDGVAAPADMSADLSPNAHFVSVGGPALNPAPVASLGAQLSAPSSLGAFNAAPGGAPGWSPFGAAPSGADSERSQGRAVGGGTGLGMGLKGYSIW
jgi:hypothetical protein